MEVYLLVYEHRYGSDILVHASEKLAYIAAGRMIYELLAEGYTNTLCNGEDESDAFARTLTELLAEGKVEDAVTCFNNIGVTESVVSPPESITIEPAVITPSPVDAVSQAERTELQALALEVRAWAQRNNSQQDG